MLIAAAATSPAMGPALRLASNPTPRAVMSAYRRLGMRAAQAAVPSASMAAAATQ